MAGAGAMVRRGGAMIAKHPVLSAAGAAAVLAGTAGVHTMGGIGAMAHGERGMHWSKKAGRMVKNRHMRVTNPRALRRAIRRAHGFARLAMKTIHLVHPKKKARFGGFKRKRK
jgi:hypothetical protein